MENSIKVKYNDEIKDKDLIINLESSAKTSCILTVIVDDNENLCNYTFQNDIRKYNSFVTVKCTRNLIELNISQNTTSYDRNYTLTLVHKLNEKIVFPIFITQPAPTYNLSVDINSETDIIELKKFLNREDMFDENNKKIYPEIKIITVEATGGLNDFGIKPIKEYKYNLDELQYRKYENDTVIKHQIPYDNGLIINKIGKMEIEIKNFGKISLYDQICYEITIYHKNDPSKYKVIILEYKEEDTKKGFTFDDEDD